jgi:catechol 2,3-dioxygenase-like lactoylglutathione lyase family enzyme
MPAVDLQHYLVICSDLDKSRDFYCDLLGLRDGKRPDFPFAGYWLYLGDTAVVHMANRDPKALQAPYLRRNVDSLDRFEHTGAVDHIAFAAKDLKGMMEKVAKWKVKARHNSVPDFNIHQMFVQDLDGLTIELNFSGDEAKGLDIPH